ncbi:hypothetical protein M422DRAFT_272420 [Sphaerobolus stellatus SS14]|uniref:Unplaced genomic scaffold SPHSTscaffold_292, whole genome shotgun sequence n=1 Tax=Sphaerobolus stellatus (strain SS14) TaxID=990650 RepID=A0A0C9UBN4_SPHS4|nr:hypothetical protein M422DRAFT_272420 [Sphaerobolus stellatus SS14]
MSFRKRRQSKLIPDFILPYPKTWKAFLTFELLTPEGYKSISRAAPGILENCPSMVPRVSSSPFPRTFVNPVDWGHRGVWYFYMECAGVSIDTVIDTMTPVKLDHVADQLATVLAEMRSHKSRTLGSVSVGPYNNKFMPYPWTPKRAFESVGEFLSYYREMFLDFCGAQYIDNLKLFSSLPRNAPITLTHGDLLPCNIIVQGSEITGIIDWETAGFYPGFWEYCRMHYPPAMTPGWDHILPHTQTMVHYNRVF